MALRDLLNLVSSVSVIREIQSDDGMGGFSSTSSTTVIPLCAIWQNSSTNKWLSDKYSKDSSHVFCEEYGTYNFNLPDASGGTVVETVQYNSEIYKTVGFQNNYLELNEIVTIGLERIS